MPPNKAGVNHFCVSSGDWSELVFPVKGNLTLLVASASLIVSRTYGIRSETIPLRP
jgi:hypothetical protein